MTEVKNPRNEQFGKTEQVKEKRMTEQIKNCNTCANATEDFNNDTDNGCYMCSKGIEDNYEPKVAEQIKYNIGDKQISVEYDENRIAKITRECLELLINSRNAWEEVLQELEESNWDWIPRDKAIDIIKQKLEGATENERAENVL